MVRFLVDVVASFPTRCRGSRNLVPCATFRVAVAAKAQLNIKRLGCFSSSTLRRHIQRAVAADVSRLGLHVGRTDSELVGCLRRPEDPRVPSVLCSGVSKKFANFLRPTSRGC